VRLIYEKSLIEKIIVEDEPRKGVPIRMKEMFEKSTGEYIVMASNDVEFSPDSLMIMYLYMKRGDLLLGAFNTGEVTPDKGNICEHFMIRADFVKALGQAESPEEVMPLIMKVASKSNKEKYGWLGNVPQLKEWLDERQLNGVADYDYEIPNKDYEATIQVDRNAVEDDQLGAIKMRISDLAVRAKQHPRKLLIELIEAGTTDLCYDGQAFFSTSHVDGKSGTQSNLLTGTGTTVAQVEADFDAALVKFGTYKDDQGEPWNDGELDLTIVAPPQMRSVFEKLFMSDFISSSSNTKKGAVKKIIYSSRLTSANDWYLFNTKGSVKPFIMQERKAPVFNGLEGASDRGFMSKRYVYGIDYRVGFGYGLWQYAVKINNA